MSLTDLMPLPYRLAAYALAALSVVGAIFGYGHHQHSIGVKEGQDKVQASWSLAIKKQQDAAIADAARNAQETARRLAAQKEAQDAYDAQLAAAQHDADAARSALDGLRKRAQQLASAARRAPGNPAPAGLSPATGDTAVLLTDVLGQLGERSQLLAAYADAARRAGQQCARDYDNLSALKAH